jgi:hypothetical protein
MRKLVLAASLVLAFAFSVGQSTALAASAPSQTIDFSGSANFGSILGGSVGGPVALSGSTSNGELGTLRGSANFPLRDEKITVGWNRFLGCDPYFGCRYEYGVSTFERTYASGPVDIRFGSLRGNGMLSFGTNSTCVAACPPAGAYWYAPYGYWQLSGAALSSQDAGNINMGGPAPTIH